MHPSFFEMSQVCITKMFISKTLKTYKLHLYIYSLYLGSPAHMKLSFIHTHTQCQRFLFFSFKKMPFFAFVISVAIISGGLAVSADSSNFLKILARTTFSSFSANCCPMQFLHSTRQHRPQNIKRYQEVTHTEHNY